MAPESSTKNKLKVKEEHQRNPVVNHSHFLWYRYLFEQNSGVKCKTLIIEKAHSRHATSGLLHQFLHYELQTPHKVIIFWFSFLSVAPAEANDKYICKCLGIQNFKYLLLDIQECFSLILNPRSIY